MDRPDPAEAGLIFKRRTLQPAMAETGPINTLSCGYTLLTNPLKASHHEMPKGKATSQMSFPYTRPGDGTVPVSRPMHLGHQRTNARFPWGQRSVLTRTDAVFPSDFSETLAIDNN